MTGTEVRRGSAARWKRLIPHSLLVALATLLITATIVGSFLPGAEKNRLGTQAYSAEGGVDSRHRLFHFGTFGAIGAVLIVLGGSVREQANAGLCAFGLGCLIEITQHVVGLAQVFEWWDVRDDLAAVGGVFLLLRVLALVIKSAEACRG